ncbi:MAG: protein translocase subunit SecD [Gammaproteobacteria bacterium]|nr:protein translocase subunit SecD [Gammaproteobacteria bacterium]
MINRYPLWKNFLIAVLTLLGFIYALPNLYPPDYAVQISNRNADGNVSEEALIAATARLSKEGIEYFGAALGPNSGLIRFNDDQDQLKARDFVQLALFDFEEDYVVALNSAPTTPDWLSGLGAVPMKYGLDLRGGVHFLMEVDTESVILERLKGLEQEIKQLFRDPDNRIRYTGFVITDNKTLQISFGQESVESKALSLVRSKYPTYLVNGNPAAPEMTIELDLAQIREIEDFAVQQNVVAIRNRVNELGVAEPLVQRLGRSRIVVDLPGVQDTARAKNILGKVATLEFRMEASAEARNSSTDIYDYGDLEARLEKKVILRGDRVLDAQIGFDPESNLPQVNIRLDGSGGELMHRATRYNVGRRMAVVFIETKTRDRLVFENGIEQLVSEPYVTKKVISLATVQSALGVNFRITGLQSGEARELALLLRAGALAADMFIAEERTVGASLGEENIKLGAFSVMVGLGLVVLFMLFRYKVFGFAANLALGVNLVLIVAVMSSLSATLTLPGIAGIVLTVGMAVDANVLIFSRIKEELASGLPPQQAIHTGFERAFVTILDANITTLIVAVILYSIGTGPVKGFAVTLSIGILTSMFTAIMGTRSIINVIYGGRSVKGLAI